MKRISNKQFSLILFLIIAICWSCSNSGTSTGEVKTPGPFYPVPVEAQLNWHKAEYIMFVHFGMKTFYPSTDHMGYGKEDPAKFNPVDFDARQWVKTAKAGGFKGIVITTKHHDGFCNWQTQTTDHSVKSSPWKNGEGDIIRELAEACREEGVYIGIYVSIIDKHFEEFGAEGFENYGDFYLAQLTELSTKYGKIDEYWFDGYKADKLKMDYQKIAAMIKEYQPDAVVYDSGTLVEYLPDRCLGWPGSHGGITPDQNYRAQINDTMRWYPNEPSIILQGNWFHNNKPAVSLEKMKDYYLTSVGYGVTPLMNISPNARGLIDDETVERVIEFKAWVDLLNANDLAQSAKVKITADSYRQGADKYAPGNAIDGDYDTYFVTDDSIRNATLEITFDGPQEIEGFILQEYIELGQRVEGYIIECLVDGEWKEVFSAEKMGYKRIILEGRASAESIEFPASEGVRLKIKDALACPLISTFQVLGSMKE